MRKRFVIFLVLALACGSQTLLALQPLPDLADDILRIHVLNIGQGLCTVIECPTDSDTRSRVVYDCGGGNKKNFMKSVQKYMAVVLGTKESYAAPKLIVSHPDRDHMGYLSAVFEKAAKKNNPQVSDIALGGPRRDYEMDRKFWKWVQSQTDSGASLDGLFGPGFSTKTMCGTAALKYVTVNAWDESLPKDQETNADSLVMRIKNLNFQALFTGDATSQTLASALANSMIQKDSLSCQALIAPHHGAFTEGSNSFLWADVVQPKVVVYSAGHNELYRHPRCKAVKTYLLKSKLDPAAAHIIECGDDISGGWKSFPTLASQFLTYTNGGIVIDGKSDGTFTTYCKVKAEKGQLVGEKCSA